MSLLSLKLLRVVPALVPCPMEFKVLFLRPAPFRSTGAPCAQGRPPPSVPLTVLYVALSASDSESVNAFVTVSTDYADASSLSMHPFQSIPVCSHHCLDTHAPGRMFAFSHRYRIGRVAINFATVLCLQRIEVRIQTIPASFIAPASDG